MKPPSLNALRVFDAVARMGGIRLAADALFVTPAAVSQQVKLLEQSLGVTLLHREGRSVALSEAGRRLHAGTTRHLRAIGDAAELVRPRKQRIRLTTVPSFAVRWLVPRLQRFTDQRPEVEVQVDADPRLMDLATGDFDLAVREGQGRYPKTASELLFPLEVQAVCTPAYAVETFGADTARGWRRARLLHEVGHPWWRDWLHQAGVTGVDASRGLHFSHTVMTIAAALEGQGVALVPPQFVETELREHRLVTLGSTAHTTGAGLWVVWSTARDTSLSPPARDFRDWIVGEAQRGRSA